MSTQISISQALPIVEKAKALRQAEQLYEKTHMSFHHADVLKLRRELDDMLKVIYPPEKYTNPQTQMF
jgi:hypothetical protein